MAIRIFVTGGTFDKEYDEITGRLFFKDTHVPEMLRLGRSRVDVAITPLMLIDSLDMTDADRQRVVEGLHLHITLFLLVGDVALVMHEPRVLVGVAFVGLEPVKLHVAPVFGQRFAAYRAEAVLLRILLALEIPAVNGIATLLIRKRFKPEDKTLPVLDVMSCGHVDIAVA